MAKQKSNVNETSKSPASKRRKRHSTPSDDKLQFLTTIGNITLKTYVILNGKEPLIITDTYHRLIAIDTWHSKWRCSYLQRKIVLLLRRIFRHKSLELGTSLWRRITDWPHNVLRKNPPKDSEIGYFDLGRCSVQSFSFKACFGIWKRIKNAEGETCWYRDPMPF